MTREDLIAFEDSLADDFNKGRIKAPLHLAGGNEDALIEIFNGIRPQDWVLSSWRAHYHALLKGVPPDELRAAIHAGRSIALTFPEHNILCSAIVGGICPIAVGLAWAIKQRGEDRVVHCFIGDMTATGGIFHESRRYAYGHDLPVRWWIEDNSLSVCTDTAEVWGSGPSFMSSSQSYRYKLTRPHVGTGKWVAF